MFLGTDVEPRGSGGAPPQAADGLSRATRLVETLLSGAELDAQEVGYALAWIEGALEQRSACVAAPQDVAPPTRAGELQQMAEAYCRLRQECHDLRNQLRREHPVGPLEAQLGPFLSRVREVADEERELVLDCVLHGLGAVDARS